MSHNTASHRTVSLLATLIATVAFVVLPACHSSAGTVEDGRYIAHDDVFSLPVPKLSLGLALQQGLDKDIRGNVQAGFVNFHDDFGNMRSIEYELMSAPAQAAMSDPGRVKQFSRDRVHDKYLPRLKTRFPGSRIAFEEYTKLPDGTPAMFAVIKVPAPTPKTANKTPGAETRRPDSAQAYLLFPHKNLYLTLSMANDPNAAPAADDGAKPSEAAEFERMKSTLTQLYESMQFE